MASDTPHGKKGANSLTQNNNCFMSEVTTPITTYQIHQGQIFSVTHSELMGNDDEIVIAIQTPNNNNRMHVSVYLQMAFETEVEYFIGDVISSGTTIIPINRNLNSGNTADSVFTLNPTIDAPGTKFLGLFYGSGNKAGGDLRDFEYVLTPNEMFVFKLTSKQANNSVIVQFNFTEEESQL